MADSGNTGKGARQPPLDELERRIGYSFTKRELLLEAITHPSYAMEYGGTHYQRLEFLGDAVLEFGISDRLYRAFAHCDEGTLTQTRASLVRGLTLARAARAIGLQQFIRFSTSEERTGGRAKQSIQADVTEAVIAAVYLDGGLEQALELVYRLLEFKLKTGEVRDKLDYKSHLQEALQGQGRELPQYEVISISGPAHCCEFTVGVSCGSELLGKGTAGTKKEAGQRAAKVALEKLRSQSDCAPAGK